jgi:hypothetical protein
MAGKVELSKNPIATRNSMTATREAWLAAGIRVVSSDGMAMLKSIDRW